MPESTIDMNDNAHLRLSDDEAITCWPYVYGFSFTSKEWGILEVAKLKELSFDATAFEQLALPSDKKNMISSLVQTSSSNANEFDDFIKGKGKGIIFLLHGPPGVGKTFTAGKLF